MVGFGPRLDQTALFQCAVRHHRGQTETALLLTLRTDDNRLPIASRPAAIDRRLYVSRDN